MQRLGDNTAAPSLGPLEKALVEQVHAGWAATRVGATGHENGGAIGVTDDLNRARIALAALRHIWGPLTTDPHWDKLGRSPNDLLAAVARVDAQCHSPKTDGSLPTGELSQNPTVPDTLVRRLFARRWAEAEGAGVRTLDASSNSVMAIVRCADSPAQKARLWDLVVQLRARRRSAQWTDATAAVQGGGRRDETTGKVTGSALATVLEWRLLLANDRPHLALDDDEMFWLVKTAAENMPFLDVSAVFQARNLTSQLRDLIGRADVSVNPIGRAPRLQVSLYAAIHQHYSADSAALVDVYIRDRVLTGARNPAAMIDFITAAEAGGVALAPYCGQTTLTGFARRKPAVQAEALAVLARLWQTVHHAVPTKSNAAALLAYAPAGVPWADDIYRALDAPTSTGVGPVANALRELRSSIGNAASGHIALQRLRLFSLLTRWCMLRAPRGEGGLDVARTLWGTTGSAAWAPFNPGDAPDAVVRAAHKKLTRRYATAARRVLSARVDVDLDPQWVDGVLKETPLAPATQTRGGRTATPGSEAACFVVDGLLDPASANTARPNAGLVLAAWHDEAVMRSRPRVVFCAADDLPPPLCHGRFWAAEQGIDIVPVRDVAPLLHHVGRPGRLVLTVGGGRVAVAPARAEVALTPHRRPAVEVCTVTPRPDEDWASVHAGALRVHLPPASDAPRWGLLHDEVDANDPMSALALYGAKSVLLAAATPAIQGAGAAVPPSVVVSYGACASAPGHPRIVDDLSTLLPPRRAWMIRSAGRDEDLPGQSRTGEFRSVGGARSRASRLRALQGVAPPGAAMSVLVQPHERARRSGVAYSRAPDGAMGQVQYQVVDGGGGGVTGTASVRTGVLRSFGVLDSSGHAPRRHRTTLREVVLDVEIALNEKFFPSGAALWPVEVEWLVARGALFVVQARFQAMGRW